MLTLLVFSTQPDLAAQRADEILHLLGVMGQRRHHTPDGARPGDVRGTARDDVDMQLRYEVAQSRDIEFVASGDFLQRSGNAGNFRHQLRLLDLGKVDDLHRSEERRVGKEWRSRLWTDY